jgi:hypothetical protein
MARLLQSVSHLTRVRQSVAPQVLGALLPSVLQLERALHHPARFILLSALEVRKQSVERIRLGRHGKDLGGAVYGSVAGTTFEHP